MSMKPYFLSLTFTLFSILPLVFSFSPTINVFPLRPFPINDSILITASTSILNWDIREMNTRRNASFKFTTVQKQGVAQISFSARILNIFPDEDFIQIRGISTPDQFINTTFQFDPPKLSSTTSQWNVNTTVFFTGFVGITSFTIEAVTNNTQVVYRAQFSITIVGLSVYFENNLLSGNNSTPYNLGNYSNWLSISQLALPIRIQTPKPDDNILPINENFQLQLTTLNSNSNITNIDSINFDPIQCSVSKSVPVTLFQNNSQENANTRFINSTSKLGVATLRPQCGISLSSNASWLIFRLEPYRVANYGFAIQINWLGVSSLTQITSNNNGDDPDALFPFQTTVKFVFDDQFVPPPILRNYSMILDPYGGERLQMPVDNILMPPQNFYLEPSNISLRLATPNGISQQIQATNIEDIQDISLTTQTRYVIFNTPAWQNQSEETITPQLLIRQQSNESTNDLSGTSKRNTSTIQQAVVQSGESVNFVLASNELASISNCEIDSTMYEPEKFLLLQLRLKQYTSETFSEYKNEQIKSNIRQNFPLLNSKSFRLISVEDGIVEYGILIIRMGDIEAVLSQAETLRRSIITGLFASKINAEQDDVQVIQLQVLNNSLCKSFPALIANVQLEGRSTRLLPLWITIGFSVLLLLFCCFVTCLLNALNPSTSDIKSSSIQDSSNTIPYRKTKFNVATRPDGETYFEPVYGTQDGNLERVETRSTWLESSDDEDTNMSSPIRALRQALNRLRPILSAESVSLVSVEDESTSPRIYAQRIDA